jgi:hypothetical protein
MRRLLQSSQPSQGHININFQSTFGDLQACQTLQTSQRLASQVEPLLCLASESSSLGPMCASQATSAVQGKTPAAWLAGRPLLQYLRHHPPSPRPEISGAAFNSSSDVSAVRCERCLPGWHLSCPSPAATAHSFRLCNLVSSVAAAVPAAQSLTVVADNSSGVKGLACWHSCDKPLRSWLSRCS